AINIHIARAWLGDARKDFEQGAFACAVAPDDAHDFPMLDLKGNILQRPDGLAATARCFAAHHAAHTLEGHFHGVNDGFADSSVFLLRPADAIHLAETYCTHCNIAHDV